MHLQDKTICLIGFGEAGRAITASLRDGGQTAMPINAYDIKLHSADAAETMQRTMTAVNVAPFTDLKLALAASQIIISVVTADQANRAAESAAPHIKAGSLFLDMNSCAPETKRQSARLIEAAGGFYVDVAVMAPILKRGHQTPMLAASAHADEAMALFDALKMDVRLVGDAPGRASMIKMLRSVMIKGIEALTAECFQAACRAGVADDVAKSLDASESQDGWAVRAGYNMERMTTHGTRRAAEMREVAKTLNDLGIESHMANATIARQDAFGMLGLNLSDTDGLQARMAAIEAALRDVPEIG